MKRSLVFLILILLISLFSLAIIYLLGIQKPQTPSSGHAVSPSWSTPCTPIAASTLTPVPAISPDGTLYVLVDSSDGNSINLYKIIPPCSSLLVSQLALAPEIIANVNSQNVLGNVEANRPHLKFNSKGDMVATFRRGTALYFVRKPAAGSSFNQPVLVNSDAYQGDVGIDSQGNVYVAWYGQGGNYRKYNSLDQLLGNTVTLTASQDSEPKMDIDSQDNIHFVWMEYPVPIKVLYQKITSAGNKGPIKTISQDPGNSAYPYIKVDLNNNLHISLLGATATDSYQVTYINCSPNAASCANPVRLGYGLSPDLAICGANPYITWYDSSNKTTMVSSSLAPSENVSGSYGVFPGIAAGFGKVHVFFRNDQNQTSYTFTASSACSSNVVVPPPTPTNTSCQGNTAAPAKCFDCKKDNTVSSEINIFDFSCFTKAYGKTVN